MVLNRTEHRTISHSPIDNSTFKSSTWWSIAWFKHFRWSCTDISHERK